MTSTVTLPQARIPIGHCVVNGQRVDVEIDIEWMRAFASLVLRSGGVVTDLTVTDAALLIFELQAEVESLRARNDGLVRRLDSIQGQIEDIRTVPDLSIRVQTIEDRLQ